MNSATVVLTRTVYSCFQSFASPRYEAQVDVCTQLASKVEQQLQMCEDRLGTMDRTEASKRRAAHIKLSKDFRTVETTCKNIVLETRRKITTTKKLPKSVFGASEVEEEERAQMQMQLQQDVSHCISVGFAAWMIFVSFYSVFRSGSMTKLCVSVRVRFATLIEVCIKLTKSTR